VDISGPRATARHLPSQDCDLVTVPARQGLEAVDILRLRDGVGPVLHDGACGTLGFLVPPGTAEGWDLPGSACTRTRAARRVRMDVPGAVGSAVATGAREAGGPAGAPGIGCTGHAPDASGGRQPADPEAHDTGWLVPPDAAYAAATTDPTELRAALGEAARTIEAADRCQ
jgi:hypothetical protein